jgi:hypothetical protein
MGREKNYRRYSIDGNEAGVKVQAAKVRGLLVFADVLPEGARIPRETAVDLRGWLGKGVDAWVDSMMLGWVQMLGQGSSTQSLAAYARAFKGFLEFLTVGREAPLVGHPSQLRPLHITQFEGWLVARGKTRGWSGRSLYIVHAQTKVNLVQLMKMKAMEGVPTRFFPPRSFETGVGVQSRYTAFSEAELSRLAKAFKADLVEVHHGKLKLRPSEGMTIRFLIVAMRTGGNAGPLMELSRKAARPGLLPGTKVVGVLKYRAKKVVALLFAGQVKEQPVLIPTDAVAILDRTLEETAHLVAEAAPDLKDRVWLYRPARGSHTGTVRCINYDALCYSIRTLVRRRGLLDDDGKPLHINVSRLRKSFGKRAFRLTDGDVVETASLLGNTSAITESKYLNPDAELLADAAYFMATELAVHLRGDGTGAQVIPILDSRTGRISAKTPVAGCKDTLHGEHAPKDGISHCDKFVVCLFCPSFAVVGELDELWRLFSFQRFAESQLAHLNLTLGVDEQESPSKQLLRKRYLVAIPFIDSFTVRHFGEKLSFAAKNKAQIELHPFWALQMKLVNREVGNSSHQEET